MKYDLISIGDPTVDTFLKVDDAHVACKLNREDCELCVNYADKIPVSHFFRFPAGNMPNNAVASTRLGMKVAAYGMVGDDKDGHWIKEELVKEGVDVQYFKIDRKKGTNSSTVLVFQGERTIFVWHETRDYALPVLPAADWVYLTSCGPTGEHLEHLHRQILGYLKSHLAKLGFNPGTYQLRMGRDALQPLLERSEIIFLNKEETEELTGKHPADIKVLLRTLQELGPKIAVITDGRNGSFVYDGHHYYALGILDLPVVDHTGSGDCYASTFLAALFYGQSIPEAMRWGTANAAYVVGEYGGILGLKRKQEIESLSREHLELKVKEI